MEEKGKRHYVLIKNFNTFMYNYTLNCRKNIFVVIVYMLLVYKKYWNVKGCFKINGKQRISMPKKGEYDKFKN